MLGALRSTSASPTARGRPSVQLRSGRWQCEQETWPFEESLRSKNSRSPRSIASALPETRLLGSDVHFAGQGPCAAIRRTSRSEEHTSELQSQFHLVCRLL